MIRSLAAALSFLTVLPVPGALQAGGLAPPAGMLWWWAPIGALIGGLAAVGVGSLAALHVPWGACATVGVVLLVVLSGGLHLDGFMDTCDGLGSRAPRVRALEIMKDPHVGAFGVIGLACLLLLKVAALGAMPGARGLDALLLAPVVGRTAQVLTLGAFRYARPGGGLGGAFFAATTPGHVVVAVLIALGMCLAVGPTTFLPMLVALALGLLVAAHINRRLGGHTGDTVGAVSETAECVFLLVCLSSGVL